MENNKQTNIPYIAYEAAMSRFDRLNRRLWIAVILLIVLLVGSNIAWLVYESQFQVYETSIEATQDGEGVNIVGGGDVNYGTESDSND